MQIQANGIRLETELHGPEHGPPLVLIRGLGTQLVHWPAALIEGFAARGFRVVIFDNRDVGLSQRCPAPDVPATAEAILDRLQRGADLRPAYTLDDMASDVVGLLDALDIPRAHVFGISMGGAIAQLLALDHGRRLHSATLVMTACRPLAARADGARAEARAGERAGVGDISALLGRAQDLPAYQATQIAEHANWGSPGFPMPESAIRAMAARAHARGVDPEGINRQLLALLAAPGRCAALRNLALPCLVLHGTDDRLVPPELGRELAAAIPRAAFRQIDGMGHIITPALAPPIVKMVSGFIARHAS